MKASKTPTTKQNEVTIEEPPIQKNKTKNKTITTSKKNSTKYSKRTQLTDKRLEVEKQKAIGKENFRRKKRRRTNQRCL